MRTLQNMLLYSSLALTSCGPKKSLTETLTLEQGQQSVQQYGEQSSGYIFIDVDKDGVSDLAVEISRDVAESSSIEGCVADYLELVYRRVFLLAEDGKTLADPNPNMEYEMIAIIPVNGACEAVGNSE